MSVCTLLAGLAWTAGTERSPAPDYLFTAAPRYEARAWVDGHDRFPAGATLMLVSGLSRRKLAPELYASADGVVSFDATRVLFAGKRTAAAHWQIWEAPLAAGAPRTITPDDADCIRPLYLPDGRVAYTRISAVGSDIEVVPIEGGKPARLTFAPGRYLTDDVLRDGRILFETGREIFTVYPDGTGVESLRCDHGPNRGGARQISSGDVIFTAGGRLARFTSARAEQVDVPQPDLETAGPVAEVSAGSWIVALRRQPAEPFRLLVWTLATRQLRELEAAPGANAVEPAIVGARTPPRQFPSALVPARTAGNLLCLDARASKTPIAGDVSAVRVYTREPGGAAVLLGQAGVEGDGSFYVTVPADRPLRIELLNGAGGVIRAERDWFWMRPSEQRICVGCHAGPERAPENKVPEVLLRTTIPEKLLGAKP